MTLEEIGNSLKSGNGEMVFNAICRLIELRAAESVMDARQPPEAIKGATTIRFTNENRAYCAGELNALMTLKEEIIELGREE